MVSVVRSTGIRRRVDDLGRVVIPAGIRRALGISEGDDLEVAVDGDRVVFAKPVDRCVFCSSPGPGLEPFRGKAVCHACLTEVGRLGEADPSHPGLDEDATAPTGREVGAADEERSTAPQPPRIADERVAGARDERHPAQDPASSTAW